MNDVDYLKQATVREMAGYLMEDGAQTIEAALDELERSPILEKVLDEKTGLYLSGPAHAYEHFKGSID